MGDDLEDTRKLAREYLIRTKIYRFLAFVFLFFGLAVFVILISQLPNADIMKTLANPFLIVIFIIPFVPAVFLSWMYKKAEGRFADLLNQLKDAESGDKEEDRKQKKKS